MLVNQLVSVIIPVYNVSNYVNKCIKSIINQSYKNLDIIIVDDGSTDDSLKICQEYALDKRIRIYHKENGGLSDARNYGLEKAKGDFILFVDSDDYVEWDYVERLLYSMIENDADISVCDYVCSFGEKEYKLTNINRDLIIDNNIDSVRYLYDFDGYGVGVWNKLFKKSFLWKNMFPKGKISEDYFVMYKIFFRANRVVYINKPLYHYIQRPKSITKSGPLKYDVIESAIMFKDFCIEHCNELLDVAYRNLVFAAIGLYNTGMIRKNLKRKDSIYFKSIVRDNYKKFSKDSINKSRRFQLFLFIHFIVLYNIIFVLFKKIRMKIKGR